MDRKKITAYLINCNPDEFMAYADQEDLGTVVVGPDGKKFRFSNDQLFQGVIRMRRDLIDGKLDEELIKRFQLMVNTHSLKDIEERIEIVRRVEAFKEDPEDFLDKSRREEDGLRALIINSRRLLKRADIPSKSMNAIIEVLKAHEMDEPHLRDAMVEGVKANTVINDSVWASIEDVAEVVDMVMGHRIGKELEN